MLSKIRMPLMRGARMGQVLGNFRNVNRFPTGLVVRNFSAVSPEESTSIVTSISNGLDSLSTSEAVAEVAAAVTAVVPEKVNPISQFLMQITDQAHVFFGIPYWEAILAVTVVMRVLLLPVAVKTVQGSARLACMRPDVSRLQEIMNADPNKSDPAVQRMYQAEMKAIMDKHQVNPVRAMLWPFSQFPIFIGFFIALREFGVHYPGIATGGAFWFENLAVADPTYILPVLNALSFLVMIEIGSDGIQANQQSQFKWVMRGVSALMIPITAGMPASIFMYWLPNNVLSVIQTQIMKREAVRQYFNIPKQPEPENSINMSNPMAKLSEILNQEKTQGFDAKPTVLEPVDPTKPTSTTSTFTVAPATGPPPVTYSAPPKKKVVNVTAKN